MATGAENPQRFGISAVATGLNFVRSDREQ
jgi:hypothetical protein